MWRQHVSLSVMKCFAAFIDSCDSKLSTSISSRMTGSYLSAYSLSYPRLSNWLCTWLLLVQITCKGKKGSGTCIAPIVSNSTTKCSNVDQTVTCKYTTSAFLLYKHSLEGDSSVYWALWLEQRTFNYMSIKSSDEPTIKGDGLARRPSERTRCLLTSTKKVINIPKRPGTCRAEHPLECTCHTISKKTPQNMINIPTQNVHRTTIKGDSLARRVSSIR